MFLLVKILGTREPLSRSVAQSIDNDGLVFSAMIDANAITCWNPTLPYIPKNLGIVAKHHTAFVYLVDIDVRKFGAAFKSR